MKLPQPQTEFLALDTLLCAYAQSASGPGWANQPMWIYGYGTGRKGHRELIRTCLRPDEQSAFMHLVFRAFEMNNNILLALVKDDPTTEKVLSHIPDKFMDEACYIEAAWLDSPMADDEEPEDGDTVAGTVNFILRCRDTSGPLDAEYTWFTFDLDEASEDIQRLAQMYIGMQNAMMFEAEKMAHAQRAA